MEHHYLLTRLRLRWNELNLFVLKYLGKISEENNWVSSIWKALPLPDHRITAFDGVLLDSVSIISYSLLGNCWGTPRLPVRGSLSTAAVFVTGPFLAFGVVTSMMGKRYVSSGMLLLVVVGRRFARSFYCVRFWMFNTDLLCVTDITDWVCCDGPGVKNCRRFVARWFPRIRMIELYVVYDLSHTSVVNHN